MFRYFKASSPRLNMLIIAGCIVMCPCAVLVGIEHSGPQVGDRNIRMIVLPSVCEVGPAISSEIHSSLSVVKFIVHFM